MPTLAHRAVGAGAETRALPAIGYQETGERPRANAELKLISILDPIMRKSLAPRFGE